MKKFSLKNFSLQKQLVILFGSVLLLILIVLIPTINYNLSQIIDKQMYDVLGDAQNNYLEHQLIFSPINREQQIYHMNYQAQNDTANILPGVTRENFTELFSMVDSDLHKIQQDGGEYIQGKGYFQGELMYYKIIPTTEAGQYLISYIYSDYSYDLVASLQQEIIYIFYIAFVILCLIVFIWVSSLIKPLQSIRGYIDGIKTDTRKPLHVKRNDEIGILANSVVLMDEELQSQNQTKEEMIHNISHDLKTPIALIKTYSESIKDGIYPYESVEASMDVIFENADRLEKKVKSLLYLNRLEYIKEDIHDEVVNMKDIIEHLMKQMKTMHPSIEIELLLEDITFVGEMEHWRICIENIIENAYRYVNNKIIISLKADHLEIFNDGPAIDEECIDELFKPYRKGVKGQFGLGLSIVAKTVEVYGYNVQAKNYDNGVCFVISKSR